MYKDSSEAKRPTIALIGQGLAIIFFTLKKKVYTEMFVMNQILGSKQNITCIFIALG